jgi:membrane-bound metal-dependent hydrolase YbcI (DUF457 family)
MPSPIGHALGGVAAAWAIVPRKNFNAAAALAAAALAPDLDLLVGDHRGISHSFGAAVIAGAVAWVAVTLTRQHDASRWCAAVTLAWGSHIVLDWLSNDTRPPIGVMALWPITRDYYKASIEIFPAVSRRWGDTRFWQYNIYAAVVEVLIMTPLLALALRAFKKK